ncbi:hypothetical protein [Micromonospora sp. B9E7]|uniref:hypothetical protein n=1 Tax=Micromonospora sp. B9E7 TaxID=3153574 RepID=UPI00325DBC9D
MSRRRAKNEAARATLSAADASIEAARIQGRATMRAARLSAVSALVGALVAGSCGVAGTGVGTYLTIRGQEPAPQLPRSVAALVMARVVNTWDTETRQNVGVRAYESPYQGGQYTEVWLYVEGEQVGVRCVELAGRTIRDTPHGDRPTSSTAWLKLTEDRWLPAGYVSASAPLPAC